MTTIKKNIDYAALSAELDQILTDLQGDDIDVDAALKGYERGLQIVAALETYLTDADNKITKLKASHAIQ